jgi:hypothetical protein
MNKQGQKFVLALVLALLLLFVIGFTYEWLLSKTSPTKKPVAVCGRPAKLD